MIIHEAAHSRREENAGYSSRAYVRPRGRFCSESQSQSELRFAHRARLTNLPELT
jgi:hypothetical protein